MSNPPRPTYRRGFTLIELLATIAIIAVLAALLLPTLGKAKLQAHKIQCANNLRQLHLAWEVYTSDNDGWLPRNTTSQEAGRFDFKYAWTSGWLDYANDNSDNTNAWIMLNNPFGSIGQYTKNPGVYKCPSDKSWALNGGQQHNRVRSYSMNWVMGGGPMVVYNSPSKYNFYFKVTDFGKPPPAKHFVFIDEHEDSINDGNFDFSFRSEGATAAWLALPSGRHGGAANLTFVDGHVETKKWLDPRTLKPVDRQPYLFLRVPDSTDQAWLRERTSVYRDDR